MRAGRALVLALLVPLAACTVAAQQNLDEAAANEIVSALESAGIAADKSRDDALAGRGFTVNVPGAEAARALDLLRGLGLPRPRRDGLGETYADPSLVPSPTEERARFLEALGNELEHTLESVDGVASARVHLVLAETDPLAADPQAPPSAARAAVLVKARPGATLALSAAEIQRLVAGGVPALAPDAVNVVLTTAPALASATPVLVALGPLRLAPGGRAPLLAGVGVLLALCAGLAVALLHTLRRLGAAQRAMAAKATEEAAARAVEGAGEGG